MRVILKPGGIVTVLLALGALGYLAMRGGGKKTVNRPVPGKMTATIRWGGLKGGTASVQNSDFSGAFVPASYFGMLPAAGDKREIKSLISGEIAEPWQDNSDWATITGHYEKAVEADGNVCQKITLDKASGDRLQFVQFVRLNAGTKYRISCRLRADSPRSIGIKLQGLGKDTRPEKTVFVSSEWRTYEDTQTVQGTEYLLMLVASQQGTVLYVDDVQIASVVANVSAR